MSSLKSQSPSPSELELLADSEFQAFTQHIQQQQLHTIQIQNKITKINDICYDKCIKLNSITNELSTDEKQCINRCTLLYWNSHTLLAQQLQKRLTS